jgi:hypothetical protein
VTGRETLYVIANDAWLASGGANCEVRYGVEGAVSVGTALSVGTGAWELTLSLDAASTTCGVEITGGDTGGDVTYSANLSKDEAVFSWTSGTEFGRGAWNLNHATYRSEMLCTYL